MDSHCMYQNQPTLAYLLAHEQICFFTCKFRCVNSESAMARAQLALKGNGRWDSDWFIAHYAQNIPITH